MSITMMIITDIVDFSSAPHGIQCLPLLAALSPLLLPYCPIPHSLTIPSPFFASQSASQWFRLKKSEKLAC